MRRLLSVNRVFEKGEKLQHIRENFCMKDGLKSMQFNKVLSKHIGKYTQRN